MEVGRLVERERQLEANGRSEYLIRGITPSVMPPLYEDPEITPIDQVISPDEVKKEPSLQIDDKDCSVDPYANNVCNSLLKNIELFVIQAKNASRYGYNGARK